MATIIVTQIADNAYRIRDAFRAANRDCYPLGVYAAIYDLIQDTHGDAEAYHLDVNVWCCDLSETTLADLYALADLANGRINEPDCLQYFTTVLYVDVDAKTVYHLAY